MPIETTLVPCDYEDYTEALNGKNTLEMVEGAAKSVITNL